MIIVISNRKINEGATDETLFGETPNEKGLDELRIAKANYDTTQNRWTLNLLAESSDDLDETNLPSQQLFTEIIQGVKTKKYQLNWVFYIHGFNQSFLESLEASRDIAQRYNVDVIVFSWPSNPGGIVPQEYQRARQAAKASANALDRTFEKIGNYVTNRTLAEMQGCEISVNLLIHSLGNFLVENYIREPIFSGETRIFDNVIFHQADVDSKTHTQWIDKVLVSHNIYVTINERDSILKASDIINPDRLGTTLTGLTAQRPIYVDFTQGDNVGRAHNLFLEVPNNNTIQEFFQRVFTGQ
ncbi:MAG: alpha/beta hydrolase [Cyanobacteria bacterium P01_G01_bin.49]